MNKITILLSFLVIVLLGCESPEEKQKKEEVKVLYQSLVDMSQDLPCSNLAGFNKLKDMEREYETDLFQEVTEDKIEFYSSECEKYRELNNLGNWRIVRYKDDFGEFTGKKGLNLDGKGTYGTRYGSFSRLKVTFAWGYKENQWSLFYLWENGYPVKGMYLNYGENNLLCRYRDSTGNTRRLKLFQYKGSAGFDPRHHTIMDDYQKAGIKILDNLIEEGDRVKFVYSITDYRYEDTEYKFELNFKYANNARRKVNGKEL